MTTPEISLDPDDWPQFRTLAHRMVDDMIDHLSSIRDQPAWRPMPDSVRDSFKEPLPRGALGEEAAYQDFLDRVRPYPNGNLHPRFWGWVQGNGNPLGMMADMLALGLNPHMAGFNQAPALVEHQVIAWLAELMGFSEKASGILVSGGTMANVIGLAVGRFAKAGFDVRAEGIQWSHHQRLLVYCSTETHGWAQKAVELLGIGHYSLRRISVDGQYRMNVRSLAEWIARDRRSGHRPLCVIATAGTVNTGATDNLDELAELCQAEDVWFHVDGAFGALARLSPRFRPMFKGIERADSMGIDLHKWMYLPFDVGCVLVANADLHREAFEMAPNYLAEMSRGVIAGGLPFADRGMDLTRSFRALKVWMCLRAYGVDRFTSLIEQNIDQARYLGELIETSSSLELLAPVSLNIVCFRYVGAEEDRLNAVNEEILLRLQERGIAVPSSTRIGDQFALRVSVVNHRSQRSDFDLLVEEVNRIGTEIVSE